MIDTNQTNELAVVVQESGLQGNKVESLLQSFAGSFSEAKKVVNEVKDIVVTDETQTDLMLKAREGRLALKKIRVDVENTRKELKEQSLREGRAIDGVANLIKALVVPVEEHLEKQEKYAEVMALKRIQEKYEERVTKLTPYVDDISLFNLKDMSDAAFDNLLAMSKKAYDDKKAAEAKAEAERIEAEKKEKIHNERRIELAPYRDFIEGTVNLFDMSEDDYQSLLKTAKSKKADYDAQQAKIRKENEELQKKAEADRKAKEEAERKLAEEKAAQEKKERDAKAAEEAKKAADEEAKRKALLAPDKDKLIELAGTIDKITLPAVASKEAGDVLNEVQAKLSGLSNYLREKSKTL